MERIDIDLLERIRLSALRIQTVCAIKKYLLDKIFWNFIPKKIKIKCYITNNLSDGIWAADI
jgi:hypothetical protein